MAIGLLLFITVSCKDVLPPTIKGEPTHIRAMYKSDPATSVVIGWNRFRGKTRLDKLYWDTVDHGDDLEAYRNVESPDYRTFYFGIYSAFVELENLAPNSRVYFVIANSYGVTQRYYVDTLPDSRDAKLSFIAGGDSRNHRDVRQNANSLVAKLKPHAVLFGGDMTDKGLPGEWHNWFEDWQLTIDSDGRVTPIVPARGNHELSNKILHKLFWLPSGNYYTLRMADGLVQTYVLNSEMSVGGNQLTWLKRELEKNTDVVWQFAVYHKPMRPHVASKSEGTNEYKYWAQLFYDHSVDLVMESDSHSVKSTWPIRPSTEPGSDEGFIRDDENGTVYVGEGCWGAPTRAADDNKSWTRDSDEFNQFKLIHVSQDQVDVRTINVDNAYEVGENSLEERFELPENLMIWTPENGDIVTIR
tara:strand:+ start:14076 stop:15320 length:1245 start_codon:yes stop_codon:yes gene_type:complete